MRVLQKERDIAGVELAPGDVHYDILTVNAFFMQTFVSGMLGETICQCTSSSLSTGLIA